MYTSKLKLILHWLLIIVAFYIFWALAYLIFVKFATSEYNNFLYDPAKFWSGITASDIFWFVIFIFGMAIVIYVLKKAMQYSPNPQAAALIFTLLIILSAGTLLGKIMQTNTLIEALPHLVVNGVFLIPLLSVVFKKQYAYTIDDDDDEELYRNLK